MRQRGEGYADIRLSTRLEDAKREKRRQENLKTNFWPRPALFFALPFLSTNPFWSISPSGHLGTSTDFAILVHSTGVHNRSRSCHQRKPARTTTGRPVQAFFFQHNQLLIQRHPALPSVAPAFLAIFPISRLFRTPNTCCSPSTSALYWPRSRLIVSGYCLEIGVAYLSSKYNSNDRSWRLFDRRP